MTSLLDALTGADAPAPSGQLFSLRPIPGYGEYRTPVDGLYLCGGP